MPLDCLINALYNLLMNTKGTVWLWPSRLARSCGHRRLASEFLRALALVGLVEAVGYRTRRKRLVYITTPELVLRTRGMGLDEFRVWLLGRIAQAPAVPGLARNSITSLGVLAITALPPWM
ncbi:hypothetical protein [Vulcanisaeta souniana]|uniref:Uncharacterized protein n=1 Tax=Vulcanisaeta souniana JCM 11219 TaxID=1293586 RepID=A0A830E4Q6_9CREN|nr:hypothetical protein [Vulcanisaeta souniana]BDR92243.1 hypothetical protein Vsou_13360 [Vulcanisaeta souniana JCM 11219]GGI86128.1 hypothetical protein GCM10007112_23930 [Vulcanisaeta souniana JCM 11219]